MAAQAEKPEQRPANVMCRYSQARLKRYTEWAEQRGVNLSLPVLQKQHAFSVDMVISQCNVYVNHK